MSEIIALTQCLSLYLSQTQLKQMRQIVMAMLCMTGRVTMLGLSRWSENRGSYRTIQRWFQTPLNLGVVMWTVIRVHMLAANKVYLLAADEVVVSKAGIRVVRV